MIFSFVSVLQRNRQLSRSRHTKAQGDTTPKRQWYNVDETEVLRLLRDLTGENYGLKCGAVHDSHTKVEQLVPLFSVKEIRDDLDGAQGYGPGPSRRRE
jgi:hypothetical protein